MARRVQYLLIDDIDGGEATETIQFGLDGANYEIDLSTENADKLRGTLEAWSSHARKARRGSSRKTTRTDLGPSPQVLRKWARAHGHELSDRGRVPETIRQAYVAAHQ